MESESKLSTSRCGLLLCSSSTSSGQNVASNEASQQLNDRGFEFQNDREVNLQSVFGSSAELPVTITSEFVHQDDPSRQANVSWRLLDSSGNVVLNWAGSTKSLRLMQNCLLAITHSTLRSKTTLLPFSISDVAPFAPISTIGHVLLSLLLVALAFTESFVRNFLSKRIEQSGEKENKPKEFRKARIGMPEMEGIEDSDDSPWRDPITL